MLVVIPVGSSVKIQDKITATVTGVLIEENDHVTYQVSWLDGATHNQKWIESFEITSYEGAEKRQIGFHRQ